MHVGGDPRKEKTPRIRALPYPFQAMVAISTDIDFTRLPALREIHRFINTTEQTYMGEGVGLDISNSLWFYDTNPSPAKATVSIFAGHGEVQSPYAREITEYVRTGWIDTLHSYGNFEVGQFPFSRAHAERAVAFAEKEDLRFPIWTNHGGSSNRQNIGKSAEMEGDKPASSAYHTNLFPSLGIEFVWRQGEGSRSGAPSLIADMQLQDKSHVFGFHRNAQVVAEAGTSRRLMACRNLRGTRAKGKDHIAVWRPQALDLQISESILDELVQANKLCIFAQHFGFIAPTNCFDPRAVSALRLLRSSQDAGRVLVARTSRLLQYNRIRDHVNTAQSVQERLTTIDILSISDPVRGTWVPSVRDLRGLTFYCAEPHLTEIRIAGKPVPSAEVVKNPSDGASPSVGIRWFDADLTDYTAGFSEPLAAWSRAAKSLTDETKSNDAIVAEWFAKRGVPQTPAVAAALRYSADRYNAGLRRYVDLFESIGFTGGDSGLDVGSGAGHWCLAFLARNERAVGLELREEYIRISKSVAAATGLSHRAGFIAGDAQALPFADESFDFAWTHGVLMYVDAERSAAEIARTLKTQGAFYCGYTLLGNHLARLEGDLSDSNGIALEKRLGMILAACLYRCGVFHTAYSRVRLRGLDDLILLLRSYGLVYVTRPDKQDGRREYEGYACTTDLVVRKDRGRIPMSGERQYLLDLAAGGHFEVLVDELERAVEAGAPGFAIDVLNETGLLEHENFVDLHARSLILSGRAQEIANRGRVERWIADGSVDAEVAALYHLDQRSYAAAEAALGRCPSRSALQGFLLGSSLLLQKKWTEALQVFEENAGNGGAMIGDWIGAMLCAMKLSEATRLQATFRDLLRRAPRGS